MRVHQAPTPHKLLTLKSRHSITLAWLLLAVQLFSQLHGLEHLEDADRDGHNEEVCQLCILSSGLDHASIDTVIVADDQHQEARLPRVDCKNFTPKLLTSYQGRAPPSSSSIA